MSASDFAVEQSIRPGVPPEAPRTASSTHLLSAVDDTRSSSISPSSTSGLRSDRPSIYSYHRYPNPIPRIEPNQIELREALDPRQRVKRAVVTTACAAGLVGAQVVVKIIEHLPPTRLQQSSGIPVLEPEASLMRQVAHPNVVRLLGVRPADSASPHRSLWLVMEAQPATLAAPSAMSRAIPSRPLRCCG